MLAVTAALGPQKPRDKAQLSPSSEHGEDNSGHRALGMMVKSLKGLRLTRYWRLLPFSA